MSWTRTLMIWALLAISPLTGVRIVCVIEPHAGGRAIHSADELGCQTVCSRRPPASYQTRCALVEDPACAFALGSSAAVLPDAPALPFTITSEPFERVERTAYARPAPDRDSPPPKA